MRNLLAVSALFALPFVHTPSRTPTPKACFIAAISVIVDEATNPNDIKYHRMAVAGIRKP